MNIILLSGGSGKRLWPLSNEIRSKQFLKVVRDNKGKSESMVQRVYRQLKAVNLESDITVATSLQQVEAIRNQLDQKVSIVVEPERRDTFPAIALSVAYLYFEKNCLPNETIIVLPVDPYVDDEYFQMLHRMNTIVQEEKAELVLMGAIPTYPSEKYGYIIPKEEGLQWEREYNTKDFKNKIFQVSKFKEKPDVCTAREFIASGGLWNCGVFAFKLSYIMEIVHSIIKCSCYMDILNQYSKLERTSFDYAVVEKADSVAVVPYGGKWKDLGTWNTLTEVMRTEPMGDVRLSDDSKNTHVINELDIPVVVLGAENMVIAASPDGVLVADKEQSSYIKKYVDKIDKRPMYEERSWGEYTVLNISSDSSGNQTVTKKKCIQAGKSIIETRHKQHLEVWTVLSGKAVISIKGRKHDAFPGDTFTIECNVLHGLVAEEDTVLLEVQIEKIEK